MGYSSMSTNDVDQAVDCNCGGGASPDMYDDYADKLLKKSCKGADAQATCKTYPPYLCSLGGPEADGSFATCTSEAVGKKAAYKRIFRL